MCFGLSQAVAAWYAIFVSDLFRYLIAASSAFVLIWVVLGPWIRHRKIQPDRLGGRQFAREFGFSLITATIFSFSGYAIYSLAWDGAIEIYPAIGNVDWGLGGWGYWAASVALIIVAHDAYFYWVHRAMHLPRLFSAVHALHHRSRAPSPWAAYAFAPAEAVVMAAFLPLFLLAVPMHASALAVFVTHMIARNVIGHCGFELFPRGFVRLPGAGVLTTVSHHDLHHSSAGHNFGLYFTWWDQLMGTEHPDYAAVFARATRRKAAPDTPDIVKNA